MKPSVTKVFGVLFLFHASVLFLETILVKNFPILKAFYFFDQLNSSFHSYYVPATMSLIAGAFLLLSSSEGLNPKYGMLRRIPLVFASARAAFGVIFGMFFTFTLLDWSKLSMLPFSRYAFFPPLFSLPVWVFFAVTAGVCARKLSLTFERSRLLKTSGFVLAGLLVFFVLFVLLVILINFIILGYGFD